MSEYLVAITIGVAALLGLPVYVLWRRRQARKQEETWPMTWIHVGLSAPPGIETALSVIQRATPGMPQAGTIEWVDGPFLLDPTYPGVLVAGTVESYRPIHIKLMYFDRPENTALAHELGHVWGVLTNQGFGESYGLDPTTGKPNPKTDTRFVAWFTDVNRQISAALGR